MHTQTSLFLLVFYTQEEVIGVSVHEEAFAGNGGMLELIRADWVGDT